MRVRAFVYLLLALTCLFPAWKAYTDSWFDALGKIVPIYVGQQVRWRPPTRQEVDEHAQSERKHLAYAGGWALTSAGLFAVFGWECVRIYRRRRAVEQAVAADDPADGKSE